MRPPTAVTNAVTGATEQWQTDTENVRECCFLLYMLYQNCTIVLGSCRFPVSTWGRATLVDQVIERWCLCLEWLRSWRSDGIKHKKNEIFLDVAASFFWQRVPHYSIWWHRTCYSIWCAMSPFHGTEAWQMARSNVWTSWFLRMALCCDQRSWELWRWSCSLSRVECTTSCG